MLRIDKSGFLRLLGKNSKLVSITPPRDDNRLQVGDLINIGIGDRKPWVQLRVCHAPVDTGDALQGRNGTQNDILSTRDKPARSTGDIHLQKTSTHSDSPDALIRRPQDRRMRGRENASTSSQSPIEDTNGEYSSMTSHNVNTQYMNCAKLDSSSHQSSKGADSVSDRLIGRRLFVQSCLPDERVSKTLHPEYEAGSFRNFQLPRQSTGQTSCSHDSDYALWNTQESCSRSCPVAQQETSMLRLPQCLSDSSSVEDGAEDHAEEEGHDSPTHPLKHPTDVSAPPLVSDLKAWSVILEQEEKIGRSSSFRHSLASLVVAKNSRRRTTEHCRPLLWLPSFLADDFHLH